MTALHVDTVMSLQDMLQDTLLKLIRNGLT